MSEKCDHDDRFRGVFLLPHEYKGCLACGLEIAHARVAELEQKNERLDLLVSEWESGQRTLAEDNATNS